MIGTLTASPARRRTPAGTPMISFRLRVDPSPDDPAVSGCVVPVVVLGEGVSAAGLVEGSRVVIEGSLTERRWQGSGGVRQSHFEILARAVSVL